MGIITSNIAKCQTLPTYTQLLVGLRVFDIRCRRAKNQTTGEYYFSIFHGIVYQHTNFDVVLGDMIKFLTKEPKEFVILFVQDEVDPDPEDNVVFSFSQILTQYIEKYKKHIWVGANQDLNTLTLGDLRGKIVISVAKNNQQPTNHKLFCYKNSDSVQLQDAWDSSKDVKMNFVSIHNRDLREDRLSIQFLSANNNRDLPWENALHVNEKIMEMENLK
jgi:predicted RNA-binding protein with RPS1 domain